MPTRTQKMIADFRRKNGFANRMESAVKVDLLRGLTRFRDSVDPEKIEAAVHGGTIGKLAERLPWHTLDSALQPAGKRLGGIGVDAAIAEGKALPFAKELRLDTKNPKLLDYISHDTGKLITMVQTDTVAAVRNVVKRSFNRAYSPADTAERIKGVIGLNERQADALERYTDAMRQSTLAKAQQDDNIKRYGAELLDWRARTVARTETSFAFHAGERAVWGEASAQGLLPDNTTQIWVIDGHPCPKICIPMNGQRARIGEYFRTPQGKRLKGPPAHPNCMCVLSLDIGDVHPGGLRGGSRRR